MVPKQVVAEAAVTRAKRARDQVITARWKAERIQRKAAELLATTKPIPAHK
jgi:hypothetical protein